MEIQNPVRGGRTALAALGTVGGLFLVLWMDLFLPPGFFQGMVPSANPAAAPSALSPEWLARAALRNALRFAALLAFARVTARPSGFAGPVPSDGAWAMGIAACMLVAAFGAAGIARAFGAQNPLFAFRIENAGHGARFFAAAAASSLAVGYAEESFFRVFAPDILARAGLPAAAAVAGLSLLFGVSHGAQGIFGMAAAAGLSLLLAAFRVSGRSAHALCLGHAIYDFAVLTIAA